MNRKRQGFGRRRMSGVVAWAVLALASHVAEAAQWTPVTGPSATNWNASTVDDRSRIGHYAGQGLIADSFDNSARGQDAYSTAVGNSSTAWNAPDSAKDETTASWTATQAIPFAPPEAEPWYPSAAATPNHRSSEGWDWQLLPDGLIYRSYLAGARESRFAAQWVHDQNLGWIWDIALGGRVGLLRYGNTNSARPEGWQVDMEGAGLPRLDLERERELVAADFRFGIPITYGRGNYQMKLAYYHLSSHLGDEYMVRYNMLSRINYSRDVLVWGHSYYLHDDVRVYGEVGWAFHADGGSMPWEFQFGMEYSPARESTIYGDPFVAINGHLREDIDISGNLVVQAGWQWRGPSGHLLRTGMQYYQGRSEQYEFYDQYEDKLGVAVWYDY